MWLGPALAKCWGGSSELKRCYFASCWSDSSIFFYCAHPARDEAPGKTQNCWRGLISHLASERVGIPQEEHPVYPVSIVTQPRISLNLFWEKKSQRPKKSLHVSVPHLNVSHVAPVLFHMIPIIYHTKVNCHKFRFSVFLCPQKLNILYTVKYVFE